MHIGLRATEREILIHTEETGNPDLTSFIQVSCKKRDTFSMNPFSAFLSKVSIFLTQREEVCGNGLKEGIISEED